jgi:type I restriction enzyme M protein
MAARAPRTLTTQSAVNAAVKDICNVLRRSNVAGALQYVPELTWILFLRILDEREQREVLEAAVTGEQFAESLEAPYRWRDWAAPDGVKRATLTGYGSSLGDVFLFVNGSLLPYLKTLGDRAEANARQKVISQIISGVERTRVDTELNFLDVLDRVDAISAERIDTTHVFPLSQVFEGLLLEMGEKNNDGGQFFTPREVIRVMVEALDPQIGNTIYDPCCGTGGFLVESIEYVRGRLGDAITSKDLVVLKREMVYGREKDDLIYPIALANLVLHGVDEPHIWHGNSLTGDATYAGLFEDAPARYDLVLTNPPFGGKEGKAAQSHFAYKTGATQVLFLQHVIESLRDDGKCAIVIDDGVLFRDDTAFVQTKRKLLDECNLWAIVSLPAGAFSAAGAGVKASALFFTKGPQTEQVWYYDISDVKVGKTRPLTRDKLADFLTLAPTKGASDRSWTVDRATIEANGYNLKAVNPNVATRVETSVVDVMEEIRADHDRIGEILDSLTERLFGNGNGDAAEDPEPVDVETAAG